MGQALGTGFISRGHQVRLGSRNPRNDKARAWASKNGPKASAGSFRDAAEFGELVVLATLWTGTENAIRLADPELCVGKVVIDVTNPLLFAPNELPRLALGHTDSGGEQVQRWLPGARVVKAFNIVGNAHMVDPDFPGGPPDMFICGDDAEAKATVAGICTSFGWPAIDIGGLSGARVLEPMCILWVMYGIRAGSWNHAFKLLKK